MLKIWDWRTGVVKHEVPVLEVVEPFIVVRPLKWKRGQSEGDGDDASEGSKRKAKRTQVTKKGKVKKGKEQAIEEGGHAASPPVTDFKDNADLDGENPEKVLVIHKVGSLDSASGAHVVFSAVGTTALFAFPYKSDVAASEIQHINFGRPVLDFTVVDEELIIVSLDGEWLPEGTNDSSPTEDMEILNVQIVKVLRLAAGKIVEDLETLKSLIYSLNSGSLLPATSEGLRTLDLYSDLMTLPKYVADDAEANDGMPIGAPELSSSEIAKKGKGESELSKKELGRLKLKQAVMAKANEKEKTRKADDLDIDEEPETKKSRSEVSRQKANSINEHGADVDMVGGSN
jgi:tRNA (guanine-N(7)-)-methyltransferase subunit TRM82